MRDATPSTGLDVGTEVFVRLLLPMMMALATGVLLTLVFAGDTLAERSAQELDQVLDELHQARRSQSWLTTRLAGALEAAQLCQQQQGQAGATAAGLAQPAAPVMPLTPGAIHAANAARGTR